MGVTQSRQERRDDYDKVHKRCFTAEKVEVSHTTGASTSSAGHTPCAEGSRTVVHL